MWDWLAPLLEAVLRAFLTPKNASATSEAERAGAAEAAVKGHDDLVQKVDAAIVARDRASAVQPAIPGLLPDDGFRRD